MNKSRQYCGIDFALIPGNIDNVTSVVGLKCNQTQRIFPSKFNKVAEKKH